MAKRKNPAAAGDRKRKGNFAPSPQPQAATVPADAPPPPAFRTSTSESSAPHAPALLAYAPAMVLLLIAILNAVNYTNSDLWGHLRFGADILANGGHPIRVDPYSYSIRGLPWIDHEWLSDLLMAKAYAALGAAGLKIIKLTCAAIAVIFMAAAVGETGAPVEIQAIVLMAVVIPLTPQMEFRPQDFSYALLSVVMALLARDNYRGRAPVWIAIPMMALWSNLHGGFSAGLAALGVYGAAAGVTDAMAGRGWARGMRFGAIFAAAALMTLATPFGTGIWYSVAHTISRPRMLEDIVEWQPLPREIAAIWARSTVDRWFEALFLGVFAGFAITVAMIPRGGDTPLVAVGVTMLCAAFSALRNLALGLIGTAPSLARHAALLAGRFGYLRQAPLPADSGDRRDGIEQPHMDWFVQGIIALLAIALAARSGLFSDRIRVDRPEPQGAVAFMREHGLSGNILAGYNWNDYLLYHFTPGSHVFIDGRYETLYPDRLGLEFADFENNRPGAVALLNNYPHDFVLLPIHYAPVALLRESPGWKLIYQDNVAMLFARADSPAAHLSGVPVTGTPSPLRFP
ncbi:MAG TPA: hypothetical protein VMT58_07565 [Candidatus Binataceae bacterium]|nr:hypothetical protein [Candidatus Binataceae bacterium]